MRKYPNLRIEPYRAVMNEPGHVDGQYFIPNPYGSRTLAAIATTHAGWDHVSVSLPNRCPTWDEMAYIKSLFFRDDEAVMQIHPPTNEHVNVHRFCLHLWRPNDGRALLRPEPELVI